ALLKQRRFYDIKYKLPHHKVINRKKPIISPLLDLSFLYSYSFNLFILITSPILKPNQAPINGRKLYISKAPKLNPRSEEHTSEPSHVSISYAVFCLKKKKIKIE